MINNVISPEFNEDGRALRRVRSFVRRQGRLTKRQEDALTDLWPSAGVDFTPELLEMLVSNFLRAGFVVGALSIGLSVPGLWLYRKRPRV